MPYEVFDTQTDKVIATYNTEQLARRDQKLFNAGMANLQPGPGFVVRYAVRKIAKGPGDWGIHRPKGNPPGDTSYELFYSQSIGGGHGGPYYSLEEAKRRAKQYVEGFRYQSGSVQIRERSATGVGGYGKVVAVIDKGSKLNPEAGAASLYEDFHGEPSSETLVIEEMIHEHEHLAGLGELMQLKIRNKEAGFLEACLNFNGFGETREASFGSPEAVILCCSEDRLQLYVRGGDQSVDLHALRMDKEPWYRDHMMLGELCEFTYRTEKGFDNFDVLDYYHKAGEDSRVRPIVLYDTRSQLVSIAGGQYKVKKEGVVN